MDWIFLSLIIGGLLSLMTTPLFIKFQKSRKMGEKIRVHGPKTHSIKVGTPTMGGVVFIVCSLIAFIVVSLIKYLRYEEYSAEGLFVFSVFLLCSLIGFIDDYISMKKKSSLGLRGWVKIFLLLVVCVYFIAMGIWVFNLDTSISIPLTGVTFELGYYYYILVAVIIIGTTNAVNLTDGLDGLAAGTTSIVLGIFMFIGLLEWIFYDLSFGVDIAVICGSTIAASIGFLWWNTAPAEIFMGDTGSFGLGGLIAAVAILLNQELLLIIVGAIFVIETLSVIIQVLWFKMFKKRVFKMAPIHHHFELMGWPEIKVIIRFWLACGLFSALGFFMYYIKFLT